MSDTVNVEEIEKAQEAEATKAEPSGEPRLVGDDDDSFLADPKVARRYGVHVRTLPRGDQRPELGFFRPYNIAGRNYRRISELREFERASAVRFASKPIKTS
jgi:hypothetical protein